MTAIQKILVPVADPRRESSPAVGRAKTLGKLFGAKVRLFSPVYQQSLISIRHALEPEYRSLSQEVLVELYMRWMADDVEALRSEGVDADASTAWDYPAHEGIVREALRWCADLVVSDTHAARMQHVWSYSNTDWNLIRDCPCLLILVRDHTLPVYETIVAAVDPAHEHDKPAALDREILNAGRLLSDAVAGDLHVANAYSLLPIALEGTLLPGARPPGVDAERLKTEAGERLHALLEGTDVRESNIHLLAGGPEQVLPDIVTRLEAQLVVMGAVSRSAIKRIFIGSTAERLLGRLSCDIMVVKPPGFRTPVRAVPTGG